MAWHLPPMTLDWTGMSEHSSRPTHISDWPKPSQHDDHGTWNVPNHAGDNVKLPANAKARTPARSGRRAMPFKATGHKGGISFR